MARSRLGSAGTRLLASIEAQDESLSEDDNPMREVALRACSVADRVEHLGELSLTVDAVIEGRTGVAVHPIYAELRQQESHLARLLVALRLPDEATGKKPTRRAMRGPQRPSKVSSIAKARERKTS